MTNNKTTALQFNTTTFWSWTDIEMLINSKAEPKPLLSVNENEALPQDIHRSFNILTDTAVLIEMMSLFVALASPKHSLSPALTSVNVHSFLLFVGPL